MLTLAIDTSCDETSAAVVCGLEVWSNVIASQVELHKPYGGVFPTVAKQAHKENIKPTVELALKRAGVRIDEVDEIAVTVGPGLAPALEVGISYAQELSQKHNKPIRPVNHMEGHILSVLAFPEKKQKRPSLSIRRQKARKRSQKKLTQVRLPALAVLVSGGHTEFILVRSWELGVRSKKLQLSQLPTPNSQLLDRKPRLSIKQLNSGTFAYTKLGQTLDDAAGEALDKIGRMLGLGYPAGPVIEEFAKHGNPHKYKMPLPMTTSKDYNLSFSGLKTHTRNLIEKILKEKGLKTLTKQEIYDLSASVQYGVFRHILHKLNKILTDYPEINEAWLGGGVAANITLRKMIRKLLRDNSRHPEFISGSLTTNSCHSGLDPESHTLNSRDSETSALRSDVQNDTDMSNSQLRTPNYQLTLRTPYSKRLCGDNATMVGINI